MRKLTTLFFIAVFAFLSTGSLKADTVYVNVMNNFFDPANFTINVGDHIKWTLMEGMHTTTSNTIPAGAASWDYTFSGMGDTYVYSVTTAGAYSYDCTFHPGMTGTFTAVNPLPFIEEFDYPAGDLLTQHGWVNHSGTGQFLTVQSGSLTYPGYPSSGIGNSTQVDGGGGSREDAHITFAPQSSGSVYASFIVNVASASAATDYFFHFGPDPISTIFRGRLFVQDDGASGFKFGVSKATSTVTHTTASYSYGQSYLVVLKYEYVGDPTGSDDIVKLYVNPDLTQPEPTADVQNSDSGSDITVGSIALRQGANTYSAQIDGIRVSNQWSDIVPVELTSFTAASNGNNITLNWSTATEVNNSGFEVERKNSSSNWTSIGFVQGNGTTTEAKQYSYIDKNLTAGNYSYRLKQVDFDGTFEYSKAVEVEVVTPDVYELAQNYPNPFNPSTKIQFSLPEAGNVKLKIYNLLGQEIKTLFNGIKEAGVHSINFDAEGLNSGIYIYRIESGNFVQVKKMTLIK